MKCKAKVWYTKIKRKVKHIEPYWSPRWDTAPDTAEICDGNIQATLKLYEEPDWGCSYPALEISYKCDKCGNQAFPELPGETLSLAELVQAAIAALPEEGRLRWGQGDTGD